MPSTRRADTEAVARFWRRYMACLAAAEVPENRRPWYRRHVEAYVDAHPVRRLAMHTADDLTRYLAQHPINIEWPAAA